MYINALLDNTGKVVFSEPLSLKREPVRVEIIIPDEAIASQTSPIRQQLDNILGKYAHKRRAVSPVEDKAAWHQHLEEKYTTL